MRWGNSPCAVRACARAQVPCRKGVQVGHTARLMTSPLLALSCTQIKQGEVFRSDTDTEVIPKLCNYVYNNTPEHLPFNEVRPRSRLP